MPPFLPAMLYISDVRQPCIVRHPLHTGHHVTETASYYHIFHQRHTSVTSDKLAPSHIIYTQSLRHRDGIILPHFHQRHTSVTSDKLAPSHIIYTQVTSPRHRYRIIQPHIPSASYLSIVRQLCTVTHHLYTSHYDTETASYHHIFLQRHTSVTSDNLTPSHVIYTQVITSQRPHHTTTYSISIIYQ